jgi:hypothetical protein
MLKPSYQYVGRSAGYNAWEGTAGKWFWQDRRGWTKEHSDLAVASGFATESEAWQSCCIDAGLVTNDAAEDLTPKFFALSAGYLAWEYLPGKWRWHDHKGWTKHSSSVEFASEDAAYKNCCFVVGLVAGMKYEEPSE